MNNIKGEYVNIAYIYILIDPNDLVVRYVGKTVYPKYRLSGHITECKKENVHHRRARWIRSLLKNNLKPILKFVKICPLSEYKYYESFYIKKYMSDKLTNSDETGQGNINRLKEVSDRISKKMGKKVYQYDLVGNLINTYNSTRTAASKLGISHTNISRCCNGIYKHAGGYIFSYEGIKVNKVENPNAIKKPVIEVDNLGNEINRWSSIMECSRNTKIDNGNISRVCNGILHSIKNRRFKFI